MNSSTYQITAIVPAAGIGSRMKHSVPKQYLMLHHKTVIEHTIDKLLSHPDIQSIIIAIQENDAIFATLPFIKHPKIRIVNGGNTRAESVLSGLNAIENEQTHFALVHDAARPCVQLNDIDKVISAAFHSPAGAILAQPIADTIKHVQSDTMHIEKTVPRNLLWRAQTPQCFPAKLLKTCLQTALNAHAIITDESSALEYCGYSPLIVEGRSDNIKITWQDDLALAEFYLKNNQ